MKVIEPCELYHPTDLNAELNYCNFSFQTFIFAPVKPENRKNMRYFITLLGACLISIAASAQKPEQITLKKVSSGMDIFTDIWQGMPDSVKSRTINQGINIYAMYSFPMAKSNFSVAIGGGISSHNLYMKGIIKTVDNQTGFYPVKSATGVPISYNKSKLNLTYFDIPLELRFKNKAEYRASVGFKVGFLLSDHTKYKGNNLDGTGQKVKEKSADIQNVETVRYGINALVGYKWVNLTFFYSLSKVFTAGKGPQVYPISLGLSLRPYYSKNIYHQ